MNCLPYEAAFCIPLIYEEAYDPGGILSKYPPGVVPPPRKPTWVAINGMSSDFRPPPPLSTYFAH